ncbi:protein of unknown function [Cupriavidus taiwanensis]|uniref:Uncharacterized protein n=1 Tax=Cupriavidus taiwanensis TaxID=164546 RepID=A0A9Q7UTG1_9BURK|nr:protein of unknown function [Cupriavidus taiwanensis]
MRGVPAQGGRQPARELTAEHARALLPSPASGRGEQPIRFSRRFALAARHHTACLTPTTTKETLHGCP